MTEKMQEPEARSQKSEGEMNFKLLIINESTANSIITDTYSTLSLLACFFVNYHFLGDSTLIKWLIVVLLFLFVCRKGDKKVKKMTPDEALAYLKRRANDD